ncbi:MAG: DUF3883 domain-containing protein [Acidobacteria bacterium]|nr:DUF3883 domain-containing protein [Acidobacteriota bacterium]
MTAIDRATFDEKMEPKWRHAPEVKEVFDTLRRITTEGLVDVSEHPSGSGDRWGVSFKIRSRLLFRADPWPSEGYVGVSVPGADERSLKVAGQVRLRKDAAPSWVKVKTAEDAELLVSVIDLKYEQLTGTKPLRDRVKPRPEAVRPRPWTPPELELVVKDSVSILEEDADSGADRAAHDRALIGLLQDRTQEEIDLVRAQVSHALQSMGLPSVSGHQPIEDASSPVRLLVSSYVKMPRETPPGAPDLAPVDSFVRPDTDFDQLDQLVEESPMPVAIKRDASLAGSRLVRGVEYADRDARDRRLGKAGEEWVVRYERCRLIQEEHRPDLAAKVKWVAFDTDGHGYDIESFDGDGEPRYIEVKTTAHDKTAAFYVTSNEADVSILKGDRYFLYRLFGFFLDHTRPRPGLFIRQGALADTCVLTPDRFVAR